MSLIFIQDETEWNQFIQSKNGPSGKPQAFVLYWASCTNSKLNFQSIQCAFIMASMFCTHHKPCVNMYVCVPFYGLLMQFSRPKSEHNILFIINYCMSLSIQTSYRQNHSSHMLVDFATDTEENSLCSLLRCKLIYF